MTRRADRNYGQVFDTKDGKSYISKTINQNSFRTKSHSVSIGQSWQSPDYL